VLTPSETTVSRRAATADRQPQPIAPHVSAVLLRVLADVMKQYGIAPAALFQGEATTLFAGEPIDVRVPLAEYCAWLDRAVSLTGDPGFGLRCALSSSESAFDLMAPLVAHVPTLRCAIGEASRFAGLVFEGAYLHLTERAGVARLRWELPRSGHASDRTIAEFMTAGILRMVRAFGCMPGELHAARFTHARPDHHRSYAPVFQGAERFSQPFTGLEFAAQALDRPNLLANPALQTLVRAQAEQRLARLGRPVSLVDRVQTYLRSQPRAQVPDMALAARDLRLSTRSLRRRLAEEGLTYRALTQALQRERACSMLRDPDFTPQAIAGALGFADAAAFHRAFKRWTGQTACEYRAAWASS
jgi:AraC-like DNA-binding protein